MYKKYITKAILNKVPNYVGTFFCVFLTTF
nr:MAG TPA: hypothetical protein [Bacteriophage sp.]